MRYLVFSILLAMGCGACTSYYKGLQSVVLDERCMASVYPKPVHTGWYDAAVDVYGRHLSGLLFIKLMPDSTTRVVFTSESGVTFFDFEFSQQGDFSVKRVISQIDKKPVINTFREDFSLLLGIPFRQPLREWHHGAERYFGVVNEHKKYYFTTTSACTTLGRMEIGAKRKRMVSIVREEATMGAPERMTIKHYTFDMIITLNRIQKDAEG